VLAIRFAALISIVSLSAGCATFSGKENAAASDEAAVAEAETRAQTLAEQVSKLETENARLTRRVAQLKRENKQLETDAAAEEAAPVIAEGPSALRDPAPEDFAPDLNAAPLVVADAPDAPTLEQTDVPIENSPRLVQPTFASTDAVFENEAEVINGTDPLYGVHLASYRQVDEARDGWRKLQRENPDELGLLEPRLEGVEIPERGYFLRLIGGGLSTQEKAHALCASIQARGLYCAVSEFTGKKLPLTDSGQG